MSLNGLNDSDSEVSVVENCEKHHLLGSTQGTTQPNVSQTSMVPGPYLDSVPYDEEPLNVSVSLQYDWQLSGHRFIGERVSRLYPNGQSAIGTVQKYLPSDGDDEALFHILHDDGNKEDLDIHNFFAAMEQYRKHFSPLNLNPAFARHFESRIVTTNRLMRFNRSTLLELSHYLDMEVVDGTTKTILSKNILTAYKFFISL